MSFTRDSYTISSSSSPTRRDPACSSPSGSITLKAPRSGMVPPLVTARCCAPGRGVSRFGSRSHIRRGRNWANSSEGYLPASISSVASNRLRGRLRKGSARRTTANHASTERVSIATAATVCCASTSSGFCGGATGSSSPLSMHCTITAASSRSRRVRGKTMPLEMPPT